MVRHGLRLYYPIQKVMVLRAKLTKHAVKSLCSSLLETTNKKLTEISNPDLYFSVKGRRKYAKDFLNLRFLEVFFLLSLGAR